MTEEIQEWHILVDMGHGKFALKEVQVTLDESSHISTYWRLVTTAMESGSSSPLKAFEHTTIHDIHGNAYQLVTNVNAIYAWDRSLTSEDKRALIENIASKT